MVDEGPEYAAIGTVETVIYLSISLVLLWI